MPGAPGHADVRLTMLDFDSFSFFANLFIALLVLSCRSTGSMPNVLVRRLFLGLVGLSSPRG